MLKGDKSSGVYWPCTRTGFNEHRDAGRLPRAICAPYIMFQLFKFLFCNSNHYFVRLQCKYVADVKTNTEHTNEPLNSHKQSIYKLHFIFFFNCPLSPPSVSAIIFPTYAPALLCCCCGLLILDVPLWRLFKHMQVETVASVLVLQCSILPGILFGLPQETLSIVAGHS